MSHEQQREFNAILARGITLADVPRCVELIRHYADDDDDEVAHMMRDKLFDTALAVIGCERMTGAEAAEFARAVLATRSLDFEEWCA